MGIDVFKNKKISGEPITMITAYDYPQARFCDEVGFDAVLVGDSVAMTVHGHKSTLAATLEMMKTHTESVARGVSKSFIVSDLPFMTYRKGIEEASRSAEVLMRAGAQAVKLEGVSGNENIISHLVESGIPVMGHLGLTPQHVHALGGYKVQGRVPEVAQKLREDALKLQELGCFSLVLECVPYRVAESITEELEIPTIGIGAGPSTDGQILVFHDVVGLNPEKAQFRFVREYAATRDVIKSALLAYKRDIGKQVFPSLQESFEI